MAAKDAEHAEPVEVSVCMTTYNHERFIRQAVRSVLDQETDFRIEVVIGEDRSSDRTRQILVEMREEHPETLRLLLHERNIGAYPNLARTLAACRGKFVAFMDGDDYWTSPDKLRRQAEILEKDASLSLCAHQAYYLGPEQSARADDLVVFPEEQKPILTIDDILRRNLLPSCSLMFRRFEDFEFPDWYVDCSPKDWAFTTLLAERGNVAFINEPLAVYRVHGQGEWSGVSAKERIAGEIRTAGILDRYLEGRHHATLARYVSDRYADLARYCEKDGDSRRGLRFLARAWREARRYDVGWEDARLLLGLALPRGSRLRDWAASALGRPR